MTLKFNKNSGGSLIQRVFGSNTMKKTAASAAMAGICVSSVGKISASTDDADSYKFQSAFYSVVFTSALMLTLGLVGSCLHAATGHRDPLRSFAQNHDTLHERAKIDLKHLASIKKEDERLNALASRFVSVSSDRESLFAENILLKGMVNTLQVQVSTVEDKLADAEKRGDKAIADLTSLQALLKQKEAECLLLRTQYQAAKKRLKEIKAGNRQMASDFSEKLEAVLAQSATTSGVQFQFRNELAQLSQSVKDLGRVGLSSAGSSHSSGSDRSCRSVLTSQQIQKLQDFVSGVSVPRSEPSSTTPSGLATPNEVEHQ